MASKNLLKLLLSTIPKHSKVLYLGTEGMRVLPPLNLSYGLIVVPANDKLHSITTSSSSNIEIFCGKIGDIPTEIKFDYVVMDDVIPYIEDVFSVFLKLRELCHDNSKLVMSEIKNLTALQRIIALFIKQDREIKNWIPKPLTETLLYLSDFWPRPKVKSFIIADTVQVKNRYTYSYSIMIPCYNEEGNIERCVQRIPDLGRDHEIIVVNDGSSDRTADIVKELMKTNRNLRLIDYKENRGKGFATVCGLNAATKDILMILDADMTVRPEDLPLFMVPFESRHAEFVNGTRMVYPFEQKAMGPVHMFGNKVFSLIFSYLLNQKVTDTLCGTKCLFRKDFQRIQMKDQAWPDFDLLFGASLLNLKIVEVPICYQPRVSGESKMRTFKHGFMLLKASLSGFLKLKLKI